MHKSTELVWHSLVHFQYTSQQIGFLRWSTDFETNWVSLKPCSERRENTKSVLSLVPLFFWEGSRGGHAICFWNRSLYTLLECLGNYMRFANKESFQMKLNLSIQTNTLPFKLTILTLFCLFGLSENLDYQRIRDGFRMWST
jgi:hypothetical protein